MILPLIAAAVAASSPSTTPTAILVEASQALQAGRLDQARLMAGKAIAAGASGLGVDRLLADLSFASGKYDEALVRYEQLLTQTPNVAVAEAAGVAALKLGQVNRALPLILRATEKPGASWRGWNARGVIADLQSDWSAADEAYERASVLAPGQAEVINNRGWSQLLRGNWQAAREHFRRAATLRPASARIVNNLELAEAALREDLPARRPGESARAWAQRLNDAGVAAHLSGNRAKATAAFAQALEASESWYARAANNLAAVTPSR